MAGRTKSTSNPGSSSENDPDRGAPRASARFPKIYTRFGPLIRGLQHVKPTGAGLIVEIVKTVRTTVSERWNWRVSAHVRLASLGSTWLLIFGASLLAPLLPLLGLARMAASGGQLFLNRSLAKRIPIAGRDRYDWLLLGIAIGGAVFVPSFAELTGHSPSMLLLTVLLPYSALQLRSFRRSLVAHRGIALNRLPLPFTRLAEENDAAA